MSATAKQLHFLVVQDLNYILNAYCLCIFPTIGSPPVIGALIKNVSTVAFLTYPLVIISILLTC